KPGSPRVARQGADRQLPISADEVCLAGPFSSVGMSLILTSVLLVSKQNSCGLLSHSDSNPGAVKPGKRVALHPLVEAGSFLCQVTDGQLLTQLKRLRCVGSPMNAREITAERDV